MNNDKAIRRVLNAILDKARRDFCKRHKLDPDEQEVISWAKIGQILILQQPEYQQFFKRKPGRPKKKQGESVDELRAQIIAIAQSGFRKRLTVREWLEEIQNYAQEHPEARKIFPEHFSDESILPSISRGRKKLRK